MDQAVELVKKDGVQLRKAARIMGVPRWSLRNRINLGSCWLLFSKKYCNKIEIQLKVRISEKSTPTVNSNLLEIDHLN